MTKFGETLDLLKSASAWDKFTLDRFGVAFEAGVYTELSSLIGSPSWYDVTGEPMKGFIQSITPWKELADRRI